MGWKNHEDDLLSGDSVSDAGPEPVFVRPFTTMPLAIKYRETFGEGEYFKFLEALHSVCREKGRLLYWQERKLERLYQEERCASLTFLQVLDTFPYEEPIQPSLEEQLPRLLDEMRTLGVTDFAEEKEIVRSVSKCGSILHAAFLTALEPHMTEAEVLEMYWAIQSSGRCEMEWRPGFCLIFGRKLCVVPEPTIHFSPLS